MPTLADIATLLGAPLPAAARGDLNVRGINSLSDARADEVTFLSSEL
ncbi:MAG: hypothetical protein JWO31_1965, partial [Phycisphaerales bacterium]|nr:hypothetical protein [Phycisphaerales bacterium]